MFSIIMTLIAGIYFILMGIVLKTKNWYSLILFRVIPAILGVFFLLQGLEMMGILTIDW